MDDLELQRMVEQISIDSFGKPFLHKAYFNSRLRTTGGRYMLGSSNIEINKKYFDYFGYDELSGIIKHELCHYHLHIEGKGFRHRDQDFKRLMNAVEAPRFCSSLPEDVKRKVNKKKVILICTACGQVYQRARNVDTKKYVCGKCRGKLIKKKEMTLE